MSRLLCTFSPSSICVATLWDVPINSVLSLGRPDLRGYIADILSLKSPKLEGLEGVLSSVVTLWDVPTYSQFGCPG